MLFCKRKNAKCPGGFVENTNICAPANPLFISRTCMNIYSQCVELDKGQTCINEKVGAQLGTEGWSITK